MQSQLRSEWVVSTRAILQTGTLVLICLLCWARSARSANLNSFIEHKSAVVIANEQKKVQREATLARLRAEAEAQARLKVPKVALLFLTRGDMPHEAAWAAWLGAARGLIPPALLEPGACSADGGAQAADGAAERRVWGPLKGRRRRAVRQQALFSIYMHPSPEWKGYPTGSVFHGRSVKLRVKVTWGSHSEVEAMRVLLRAALEEPLNQHFVYLCETSIPLYPPTLVYSQLILGGVSRTDACPKDDPEDPAHSVSRWREGMLPLVPRALWRKSGQWVSLTRPHAALVAADVAVASEFEEHCALEANEHYFGVLLAVHGRDNETACASNAMSCVWPWETGVMTHPVTFQADQITPDLILERRHNRPDWKTNRTCFDQEAIDSAAGAFISVGPDWTVKCGQAAAGGFDAHLLAARPCTLFGRKMSPFAKLQVEEVVTSCDPRLRIAPRRACRKKSREKG